MTIELKANERLDDLQRNGYKLIQNSTVFCFGMDAVLLTAFSVIKDGENMIDLGCGNGVIPILLKAKTGGAHFTGLEIQDINVDMARRSVEYNGIGNAVEIVQGDIKEACTLFQKAGFDVVTSNPPYMTEHHGLTNPESHKAIARHELLCTLEDVVKAASGLLKVGGRFYMVHRPQRLDEIFGVIKANGMEPKRMRLVYPFMDKEANMVLIESVKGAKPMLKVEKPLIIYQEPGVYTQEVKDLYE